MPEGITINATDEQLAGVKYDDNGLVAAIAQDVENGDVLMLAWMNAAVTGDDARRGSHGLLVA